MTEYGVLLADDSVAPCATLLEAVTYSRGADREICVRNGDEWEIVAPTAYSDVPVDCLTPSNRSLYRHDKAGEPRCGSCKRWHAADKRRLYWLNKEAS